MLSDTTESGVNLSEHSVWGAEVVFGDPVVLSVGEDQSAQQIIFLPHVALWCYSRPLATTVQCVFVSLCVTVHAPIKTSFVVWAF